MISSIANTQQTHIFSIKINVLCKIFNKFNVYRMRTLIYIQFSSDLCTAFFKTSGTQFRGHTRLHTFSRLGTNCYLLEDADCAGHSTTLSPSILKVSTHWTIIGRLKSSGDVASDFNERKGRSLNRPTSRSVKDQRMLLSRDRWFQMGNIGRFVQQSLCWQAILQVHFQFW